MCTNNVLFVDEDTRLLLLWWERIPNKMLRYIYYTSTKYYCVCVCVSLCIFACTMCATVCVYMCLCLYALYTTMNDKKFFVNTICSVNGTHTSKVPVNPVQRREQKRWMVDGRRHIVGVVVAAISLPLHRLPPFLLCIVVYNIFGRRNIIHVYFDITPKKYI